jgi:hypothetical protein
VAAVVRVAVKVKAAVRRAKVAARRVAVAIALKAAVVLTVGVARKAAGIVRAIVETCSAVEHTTHDSHLPQQPLLEITQRAGVA